MNGCPNSCSINLRLKRPPCSNHTRATAQKKQIIFQCKPVRICIFEVFFFSKEDPVNLSSKGILKQQKNIFKHYIKYL